MGYKAVHLPDGLVSEVDALVTKRYRGYRSRAELTADAVRRLLDETPPTAEAAA